MIYLWATLYGVITGFGLSFLIVLWLIFRGTDSPGLPKYVNPPKCPPVPNDDSGDMHISTCCMRCDGINDICIHDDLSTPAPPTNPDGWKSCFSSKPAQCTGNCSIYRGMMMDQCTECGADNY